MHSPNQQTKKSRYNYYGGSKDRETVYVYNDLGNLVEKNIEVADFDNPDYDDEY